MIKILQTIVLIIFILFITNYAIAEIYKWRDKDGKLHFGNAPPSSVEKVEEIDAPDSVQTYSSPDINTPQNYEYKKTKQKARTSNSVEIYTTSWCGYCKKAISFLRSNGISYQEYDIEKSRVAKARMKSLGGSGGVPFAVINGNTVSGFSRESYKRALGLP